MIVWKCEYFPYLKKNLFTSVSNYLILNYLEADISYVITFRVEFIQQYSIFCEIFSTILSIYYWYNIKYLYITYNIK